MKPKYPRHPHWTPELDLKFKHAHRGLDTAHCEVSMLRYALQYYGGLHTDTYVEILRKMETQISQMKARLEKERRWRNGELKKGDLSG